MSISSIEDHAEISARETSDMETTFDLSKVKQEVNGEDIPKVKQQEKGLSVMIFHLLRNKAQLPG